MGLAGQVDMCEEKRSGQLVGGEEEGESETYTQIEGRK